MAGKQYSSQELEQILCADGLPLHHSVVVGSGDEALLGRIDAAGNFFADIIEDDLLYQACVSHVLSKGQKYESPAEAIAAWRVRGGVVDKGGA